MDILLYQRIRDVRIEKGFKTQQSFADALGVSLANVKSWESKNKPVLPRLDTLLEMCDLFECDLDYLVGRMKERTHDVKTACEITGLSEKAIEKMISFQMISHMNEILSRMIESARFENLITSYKIYLEFLVHLKPVDLDNVSPWEELSDGKVTLNKNSAVKHFKQEVSLAMNDICDLDYVHVAQNISGWRGAFREILKKE